jgi:hypothetical protein
MGRLLGLKGLNVLFMTTKLLPLSVTPSPGLVSRGRVRLVTKVASGTSVSSTQ